jgi:hypothetical protein
MSRFVAAGGAEAPVPERAGKHSDEWLAVQKELEAERRRREDARTAAVGQNGEKSLYEVLQANKGES